MNFKKILIDFVEKKLIQNNRRYARKLRSKGKDLTFSFWWWLAKNIQIRSEFEYICYKIVDFYEKTESDLQNLCISEILVLNNTIFIHIYRPGLIIGKGGKNLEKLIEHINNNMSGQKINNYEIRLIEDINGLDSMVAYYYILKNKQRLLI